MDSDTVVGPTCEHLNKRTIYRSKNTDGSSRCQYECRDCGFRWNEGRRPRPSKLSDEQVIEIMLAPTGINMAEMGRRYGVSRDAIRQIRNGTIYRHLRPDIDRIANRTCESCRFHQPSSGCLFRFPEYTEIGHQFAGECVTYMKICDSAGDELPDVPQT